MIVLGVDPGTRITGVGLVASEGSRYRLIHFETLHVKTSLSISKKLFRIHEFIGGIIKKYQPEVLALENIFFGQDIQAMVKIGEARACAMLAASQQDIPVLEYPPARVKLSVCGNGRASKDQVQHMVKSLLGLSSLPPPDGADALAVAICHLNSHRQISKEFLKKPVKGLQKNQKIKTRVIG